MILTEFALALILAGVFAAILIAVVGWDGYAAGGWPTAVVMFGVLFLMIWAGGIWLSPVGPQLWGANWIAFVVMGFVSVLLLAPVLHRPRTRQQAAEQAEAKEVVETTASVFLWALVAVLLSAIVLHYAGVVERRDATIKESRTDTLSTVHQA